MKICVRAHPRRDERAAHWSWEKCVLKHKRDWRSKDMQMCKQRDSYTHEWVTYTQMIHESSTVVGYTQSLSLSEDVGINLKSTELFKDV